MSIDINTDLFLSFCPRIREICLPINLYLSIRYFRVVRSYADGKKYTLCSDELWLRKYFEQEIYNIENSNFHRMPENASGISVHGTCDLDHPICNFLNDLCDICGYDYVLTIYEKNDDYIDLYDFGVSGDAHVAHNIFLNNQNLFRKFIEHFIEVSEDMLKLAYENRFQVDTSIPFKMKENWMIGLEKKYEQIVNNKIPMSKLYINDYIQGDWISQIEAEMIFYLIKGLDNKEVCEKLKIDQKRFDTLQQDILSKFKVNSIQGLKKAIFTRKLLAKIRVFTQL